MLSYLNIFKKLKKIKPCTETDLFYKEFQKNRINGKQFALCLAPFRSLRFSVSGSILACCYNKEFVLGTYPEQTIKEIWQGEKIKKLRTAILNHDLTLGCKLCQTNICNQNWSSVSAIEFDRKNYKPGKYPEMMEFELSNKCNLECIMCSGDLSSAIRSQREKKKPYLEIYNENFIDQLDQFIPHLVETSFIGGEPFLIDIYFKIWEKISQIHPTLPISITTNGTILNNKIKEALNKGNFNIRISLESLQKGRYEQIRKKGNFDTLIKNITYFQNYCKIKNTYFDFKILPMIQNWDEIPAIIDYCNKHEIPVKFQTVYFPPKCALWNKNPDILKQIINTYENCNISKKGVIQQNNYNRFYHLLQQIKNYHKNAISQYESLKELQKKSTNNLKIILEKRIVDYLNFSTFSEEEKNNIMNFSRQMFIEINDENILKTALLNFIELPVDILVAEIKVSSLDKLNERAISAGMA